MPSPSRANPDPQGVPETARERRRAPGRAAPGASGPEPGTPGSDASARTDRVEIRDLLGNFSDQTGANFQ